MDMTTEHENLGQSEPILSDTTSLSTPRRNLQKRIMVGLSALALVLAAGSIGFILGHPNSNTTNAVAQQGTPNAQLPPGGNGYYGYFGGNYNETTPPPTPRAPEVSAPSSAADAAAAKIAKTVDPGLVDINTNLSYQQATAAGTGMILTSKGLVLTNNHVIAGATSISARDVATNKTYTATVVGYDVTSDIAVLQLNNASGLTTIKTNTEAVTKGESVVGIGNAGGVGGTPSYAAGSVLAVGKTITAYGVDNATGSETLKGLIEISAGIQAGDSGGALVNAKGQVIGMDTAASSVNQGPIVNSAVTTSTQAFAIPISTALSIAKKIENGSASSTVHIGETAFLGIEVAAAANPFGGIGDQPPSTSSGVTVAATIPGTAAANSALSVGDVIVSVNGQSVSTVTSLDDLLQTLNVGDTVNVGYTDTSGAQATLALVLGSGPPQ